MGPNAPMVTVPCYVNNAPVMYYTVQKNDGSPSQMWDVSTAQSRDETRTFELTGGFGTYLFYVTYAMANYQYHAHLEVTKNAYYELTDDDFDWNDPHE